MAPPQPTHAVAGAPFVASITATIAAIAVADTSTASLPTTSSTPTSSSAFANGEEAAVQADGIQHELGH